MVVEGARSNVEIKVHPRRGDNLVHPLDRHQARQSRPQQQIGGSAAFKKWFPWLVPLFVVANVVLFAAVMYVNDCPKNSGSCIARFLGRFSFQTMKENPLLGPSAYTLENLGALDVDRVVHRHQAWRLISCIWLHAGVFHLLANMLSLLFIGIRLEQEFGFILVGLVYLLSGFGGSLMSALFIQSGISVGASGALFGLLGGMLSELITNWSIYEHKLSALLTLVLITALNLAVGFLPHVDNYAHIGGFLSGFFLGFVCLIRPQYRWLNQKACPPGYIAHRVKRKYKTYQYILLVISLIILLVGFTVGLVALLRGINLQEHCSWCHYLSCIPTSLWSCKSEQVYCQSTEIGSQLNLTCLSNGKTEFYNLIDENSSKIQRLCTQLCS